MKDLTISDLFARLNNWLRGNVLAWLQAADKGFVQRTVEAETSNRLVQINELRLELEMAEMQGVQGLQAQIDEWQGVRPSAPPKVEEPQAEVSPGYIPWSRRKRAWTAEHAQPLQTPAGQQIEENARIIASGTRKPKE